VGEWEPPTSRSLLLRGEEGVALMLMLAEVIVVTDE
jgi:hypothetical protein